MALWIALSMMLALTLAILLRPLFVRPRALTGGDDREVFAAQLDELEADRRRGLLADREAEATRAEIARRLLRARGVRDSSDSPRRRRIAAALVVTAFVTVFSLAAYLTLGEPYYADQPLAARLAPISDQNLAELLARAEKALADNPDDGEGWIAVAPVYQRMGRYADAADAFARANALLGERAEWLARQGENLAYANEGRVTDEAMALLQRALSLQPEAVRPVVLLAIAERQRGEFAAARERWQGLLGRSDGTEPWLEIARAELASMTGAQAVPGPGDGPGRAPDVGPQEGADNPPPAVEAMVAGLADRLAQEGGTVDEWVRLVRSYTVLGRVDQAREAIDAGLAALEGEERAAFGAAPEVEALRP